MTQNKPGLYARVTMFLQFLLARIAVRLCGVELLYWVAPDEWEAFKAVGGIPVPEDVMNDLREFLHTARASNRLVVLAEWLQVITGEGADENAGEK